MKKLYYLLLSGMLSMSVVVGLTSCDSYLDREPATEIDPEAAYKNFYNFQGFTEELYHCIPDFCKSTYNNMWNWGEEEHYSSNGRNDVLGRIDRGDFWISESGWLFNSGFEAGTDRWKVALWQGCWYGIRKVNMGLENLDKMAGTQEEKNFIEGQLYFFRAWFYFHLINFWGGMPYIDYVLPAGEKLTLPRMGYVECIERLVADFEKAESLMPVDWDDTTVGKNTIGFNELRINKYMASVYIAKAYLYAGSPWMNDGNYNTEYCKKAADKFGEFLTKVEAGETRYQLVDWEHYAELWRTNGQNGLMPGSTEAIFRGPSFGSTDLSLDKQYLAAQILYGRSWSLYPTANYANYFGMANGLPINEQYNQGHGSEIADAESGYDPQYPWKGRDPRFYLTYAFDTQRMILNPPSNRKQYTYANLYTYRADDEGTYRNPVSGSTTGYLLIKFDPVGFNQYDNKWNAHHIHIAWVRLSDVYLMYAEAVANGYGAPSSHSANCSLTALDAVDKIRERANVGVFANKYRGTVEAFMTELQRERAVELAWEGHRFNDLRRWMLFDKKPYTIKTKIEFDRAEPEDFDKTDPTQNKVLNLREEIIVERNFNSKHYWLPIKKSDTYLYPDFPQNPGW